MKANRHISGFDIAFCIGMILCLVSATGLLIATIVGCFDNAAGVPFIVVGAAGAATMVSVIILDN